MSTIQNLLVDQSFIDLDRQLKRFNIFDVLNVREYEIRHTRFLAHMLDPYGTHGLGHAFLRNFLLQLSVELEGGKGGELLADIHQLDLDLTRVIPEISFKAGKDNHPVEASDEPREKGGSGRLDILLQIPRRGGGEIAIAIENKINATESAGQLARYTSWMHERFGQQQSVLVFLTVNEEDARPDWHSVTYSNVVYPALELTAQTCDTLGRGPAMLIEHYRSLLRDKMEVEEEAADSDADSIALDLLDTYPAAKAAIDQLCRDWGKRIDGKAIDASWGLYNRYRDAFDFLSRYASDERSAVLRWFMHKWPRQVASGATDLDIFIDDSGRSIMRFLAWPGGSALADLSKKYAQKESQTRKHAWTSNKHSVLFELRSYPLKAGKRTSRKEGGSEFGWDLHLTIGPLEDVDRNALIGRLREELHRVFPAASGAAPIVSKKGISSTFFSIVKWKLVGGTVAELEKQLTSTTLLSSIAQAAAAVERVWADEAAGASAQA